MKPDDQPSRLCEMLQSERCVYFRCSNPRRDGAQSYLHEAGDPVETDFPLGSINLAASRLCGRERMSIP